MFINTIPKSESPQASTALLRSAMQGGEAEETRTRIRKMVHYEM
jgi:hypothetical protein